MNGKRQMPKRMWKTAWCGAVLVGAFAAQAADFSVGRVEISFAEEGWTELPLSDRSQPYGGDRDGALKVESKLYVLERPEPEGQTLVLVSANSQGLGGGPAGYMTYTANCRSDERLFREGNEGVQARFNQCLTVTPKYTSDSVFTALAPEVLELQKAGTVTLQRPVFTVWSRHAISTGSFLDVRVFVATRLESQTAVSSTLPPNVPSSHVAWGRQLKAAVEDSVYSLSGRLRMPPFKPAALPPAGLAGGG
jgi:hypothetical protein